MNSYKKSKTSSKKKKNLKCLSKYMFKIGI
jgi:hypothetical protein